MEQTVGPVNFETIILPKLVFLELLTRVGTTIPVFYYAYVQDDWYTFLSESMSFRSYKIST